MDGIGGNEGEKVWVVMSRKKIFYLLPHSVWKPGVQMVQAATERELGDERRKGPTKRKAASVIRKRREGGLEYKVLGNC